MTVTAANILMGPGSLYYAPFGTTYPADSAATVAAGAPSGFTDVGGTRGGLTLMVDQTIQDLTVDQIPDPVGGQMTGRKVQLQTELAETTLANLGLILNGLLTIGTQSAYTTGDLVTTVNSFRPTYVSLIFDGWAPSLATGLPARERFNVFKALSTAKVQAKNDTKNQKTYGVTFTAYWVSPSQSPVHWVDQTS